MSDLSPRARDVLRDVRLVAAEDTRHTGTLLRQIGSDAQLVSAHSHNERSRIDDLLAVLRAGEACALVSDAGTPAVSDPGARLVALVRAAGFPVIPIPGPSSVVTLLSAAGIDADRFGPAADRFHFEGFLPTRSAARRKRLQELARIQAVVVLMEAPHRIEACLQDLPAAFGPARTVVIGRELTKRFEQIVSLPTADAPAWLASDSNHGRGEFVLAVAPVPVDDSRRDADADDAEAVGLDDPLTLETSARALMTALVAELPPARAAKLARKLTGLKQETLYAAALELRPPRD